MSIGIQSVGHQLLGLVCGAVRGLRTKVWVWSGVEEEVEIEENDGEGKEEWHFFGMGKIRHFNGKHLT